MTPLSKATSYHVLEYAVVGVFVAFLMWLFHEPINGLLGSLVTDPSILDGLKSLILVVLGAAVSAGPKYLRSKPGNGIEDLGDADIYKE